MYKILIVEDDETIRNGIKTLLELQGYYVDIAVNGVDGLKKFDETYSLVIMDIIMPLLSGIDACKKLREESSVPFLFLTAKSSEIDIMQGFEVGGDDYLVKPFSNMELISRVKALLRRRNVYDREIIEDNAGNEYIERKDIRIYENKNRVEVNGVDVKFTRKEYEIIKLLAEHPDRIYTLEVIYSNIWEELYTYNSGNTVMVHIKNIRNKFYEICNRAVIETIWGKGYKFEK